MYIYTFKPDSNTFGVIVVIASTMTHAQQLVDDYTVEWTMSPVLYWRRTDIPYDIGCHERAFTLVKRLQVNSIEGKVVMCDWDD